MASPDAEPVSIAVSAAVRVSGLLLAPPRPRACYVLAHGAGAGMTHPFMAAVAAGLGERGIATLRYQFPYMEQGSKRPDPPKVAHAAVRAAVAEARAAHAEAAALCRRQVVRRPHDLAGAGARAAARRARACLPRLSAASRRQAVAASAANICSMCASRCCSCRARATRSRASDELEPLCAALGARATLRLFADADHSFHVPARTGRKDARSPRRDARCARRLDRRRHR